MLVQLCQTNYMTALGEEWIAKHSIELDLPPYLYVIENTIVFIFPEAKDSI